MEIHVPVLTTYDIACEVRFVNCHLASKRGAHSEIKCCERILAPQSNKLSDPKMLTSRNINDAPICLRHPIRSFIERWSYL